MLKDRAGISDICNFMLSEMPLGYMAGIAMGVINGDQTFTGAAGYRNNITKDPLKADDIFHCASISKTFTSTGIMKLVEDGTLDLNDKLVDLLPYLSIADKRFEKIRLHHMMSHIAGLQDMVELGWESPQRDSEALKRRALSSNVKNGFLCSDPDDNIFMYSDLSYDLLGLIIQEKSGMEYEEFIKKNFFEPAGMQDSTFLTFERTGGSLALDDIDKAGLAMPHVMEGQDIVLESVYPYSRQHAPSSTLTSNVKDLLKWARFNMDKKAASKESYDKMWTERVAAPDKGADMGMGWFIRKRGGYKLIGHEGGDVGFRTSFWTCPELDIATVILTNTTEAPIELIVEFLFAQMVKAK